MTPESNPATLSIRCDLVDGVPPKKFAELSRHHYYLRIWIDGNKEDLEQIELVKYTLDPTFKDRYRVATEKARNFDVRIWTYGYFPVTATVFLKNGRRMELTGEVKWIVPKGMPFDDH